MFLIQEVKNPVKIIIIPWPKEKRKSKRIENITFFVRVAKPIIEAKIGVEHGVDARAKKAPKINGYKK